LMEEHEEMAWMLRSFIEGNSLQPNGVQAASYAQNPVGAGN
jgi:starvation-inducible DNA-binding protein